MLSLFKVEFFDKVVARVDWLNFSLIFDSHDFIKKLTHQTTQRTRLTFQMLPSAVVGLVAKGDCKGGTPCRYETILNLQPLTIVQGEV